MMMMIIQGVLVYRSGVKEVTLPITFTFSPSLSLSSFLSLTLVAFNDFIWFCHNVAIYSVLSLSSFISKIL
jgi:hypothetical protein